MKNSRNNASRLLAASESIVMIADNPFQYYASRLSIEIGVDMGVASHGLDILYGLDWLCHEEKKSGAHGRPRRLLSVTPKLFMDYREVSQNLFDAMSEDDKSLLYDALETNKNNEDKTSLQKKRSTIQLIGTCAVLAEQYEPAEFGQWLRGEHGWRALVRLTDH